MRVVSISSRLQTGLRCSITLQLRVSCCPFEMQGEDGEGVLMQREFLCMARRTFLRRVPEGRCAALLGDEIAPLPVSGSLRMAPLDRPDSLGEATLRFVFARWSACDRVG
jgi:hypothetical protein